MKPNSITGKDYLDSHAEYEKVIQEVLADVGLRTPEAIECRSRDGFFAASHNCGGFETTAFTALSALFGSGYRSNSDRANEAIENAIDFNLSIARDNFKEAHAGELVGLDDGALNYTTLYKLGLGSYAEELSTLESECMDEDTVMLQVRVMYHGNGSATVDSVINWEAPYHRSMSKFETVEQVEIEFANATQLKKKLVAAVAKVTAQFGGLVNDTF